MDDHSQWLLSSMEEYEAWLDSLKPKDVNEHLTKLEEEQREHRRNLPEWKILKSG